MISDELWIIAIACLAGISCSLVGVFLVLRRLAMLGDAISHSVLFGLITAFILFSSRSPIVMFLGATAAGLLTAYLTDFLNRHGKLKQDASIGVTFTWLFAVGIILISAFAAQVDLDQECVLYGEIAFAPFDRFNVFGLDIGPRAFWILLFVTILNLIFVAVGFRRLRTIAFDPVLASTLGLSVTLWHYLLMTLVSVTTVAAFESVGAILVVALLVIPANAAYLLSKSLSSMLMQAVFFSVLSALAGYFFAAQFDVSISGAIVVASGVILLFVIIAEKALVPSPQV